MYSSIGGSAPLHCTSVAKAILAHQPKKVLDGLLKDVEFTKHTESTITNAVDLMRELELTRERGYSVDNREHEDFVHCVGVPIRTSSHEVRFSLSLTAPVFTTSWEELTSYIPRLQEVAREIATELS
jgi:DNA-binding IclR family transcriptional regulator